jgi:G3E family GTPase
VFCAFFFRPRTSLEAIRQQIRQIESEIRISNCSRNTLHNHDLLDDEFLGNSRPIQASFSSQSIPANFNSCEFDSSSSHRQRNNNKFHPHMQRAYSVDVAVHSAISDIQSAVRRNSMIRLKSSTSALHKIGMEEEDSVWVKRLAVKPNKFCKFKFKWQEFQICK